MTIDEILKAIEPHLEHVESYLSTLTIKSKVSQLEINYFVDDYPHFFQILVTDNFDNVISASVFENQKLVLDYIKRYLTRQEKVEIICKSNL